MLFESLSGLSPILENITILEDLVRENSLIKTRILKNLDHKFIYYHPEESIGFIDKINDESYIVSFFKVKVLFVGIVIMNTNKVEISKDEEGLHILSEDTIKGLYNSYQEEYEVLKEIEAKKKLSHEIHKRRSNPLDLVVIENQTLDELLALYTLASQQKDYKWMQEIELKLKEKSSEK